MNWSLFSVSQVQLHVTATTDATALALGRTPPKKADERGDGSADVTALELRGLE
ncbi:hypothetical protein RvY_10694 [Ramazzottius varieornatus]|uniref:Uncharacterized protein n=1 Tax=Ramazzottius varieornatus TaxID=947166 RepID=A0A1D1VML4_RAMVA|nr:hypothetical protein RvY_10694 [Ramazzottius varieornatus]